MDKIYLPHGTLCSFEGNAINEPINVLICVVKNKARLLSPGPKSQPELLIGHKRSCDQLSSPGRGASGVRAFSASVVLD